VQGPALFSAKKNILTTKRRCLIACPGCWIRISHPSIQQHQPVKLSEMVVLFVFVSICAFRRWKSLQSKALFFFMA
jgi:hypothetical protein